MAWRRVTVFVAAAVGALLIASPASAAPDADINLNSSHKDTFANDFKQGCDGPFEDLDSDQDGWHFVLPSASGRDFKSVSLTFNNGSDIAVSVTNPTGHASGTGWTADITATGAGVFKHLYVVTTAGWKLVNGTATVTRADGKTYSQNFFNLSHTCAGEAPDCTEVDCDPVDPCEDITSDECNPPVDPCDEAEPIALAAVAALADDPSCETETTTPGITQHPNTGTPLTGILVAGAALLAGGTALLLVLRRRRATAAQ